MRQNRVKQNKRDFCSFVTNRPIQCDRFGAGKQLPNSSAANFSTENRLYKFIQFKL